MLKLKFLNQHIIYLIVLVILFYPKISFATKSEEEIQLSLIQYNGYTINTQIYNYPINFWDDIPSIQEQLNSFRKNIRPETAIGFLKPKAEKGDVISMWLLSDAYLRMPNWSDEASKWTYTATLMTLMDNSICLDNFSTPKLFGTLNVLFKQSIINLRMHDDYLKTSLLESRDFILKNKFDDQPAYLPSETCLPNIVKNLNATIINLRYKNVYFWNVSRDAVFHDFLKKAGIDFIPTVKKEGNKDYLQWKD